MRRGQPLAQAVHGVGGLTERATVVGLGAAAVVPVAAVAAELAGWYADEGTFEELERTPLPTGELVTFTLRWVEAGVPHAVHQAHVIEVAGGRITRDEVWCGGRWSATLLAEMAGAQQ